MNTLFLVPEEIVYNNGIKITIDKNLKDEFEDIYNSEFERLNLRNHKNCDAKAIKESKKHVLESVCHQIALITVNQTFYLSNDEIVLSTSNTIQDKKVHFQKEAMMPGPVLISELDKAFNENIKALMRTASICAILSL